MRTVLIIANVVFTTMCVLAILLGRIPTQAAVVMGCMLIAILVGNVYQLIDDEV